jgi:hypothetical protein
LVQIIMKIFIFFGQDVKKKNHFCIKEVVEHTSHIGWIEQIDLKKMVHCLWNQDNEILLGRKVIHFVILLTCFFYYDSVSMRLYNKLGWFV